MNTRQKKFTALVLSTICATVDIEAMDLVSQSKQYATHVAVTVNPSENVEFITNHPEEYIAQEIKKRLYIIFDAKLHSYAVNRKDDLHDSRKDIIALYLKATDVQRRMFSILVQRVLEITIEELIDEEKTSGEFEEKAPLAKIYEHQCERVILTVFKVLVRANKLDRLPHYYGQLSQLQKNAADFFQYKMGKTIDEFAATQTVSQTSISPQKMMYTGRKNYCLPDIHRAAHRNNIELIHSMLKDGTDINFKDSIVGFTPLHYATLCNLKPMVAFLLELDANSNAQSFEGDTPLHVAAWANNRAVAELLLCKGSNLWAQDSQGRTALDIATLCGYRSLRDFIIKKDSRAPLQEVY